MLRNLLHENHPNSPNLKQFIEYVDNNDAQALIAFLDSLGNDYQKLVLAGNGIDGFGPLDIYAKSGNDYIVDIIKEHTNVEPRALVRCYAEAGQHQQVNALLEDYGDDYVKYAVKGFAKACHKQQVDELIAYDDSAMDALLVAALEGYAEGGHVEQVDQVLVQLDDGYKNIAIKAYAIGGHVEQVEAMRQRGAYLQFAEEGYAIGGYLQLELATLYVLSHTLEQRDRESLLRNYSYFDESLLRKMLHQAKGIHRYMHDFAMPYDQAKCLQQQNSGTWTWLLQGPQTTLACDSDSTENKNRPFIKVTAGLLGADEAVAGAACDNAHRVHASRMFAACADAFSKGQLTSDGCVSACSEANTRAAKRRL